MSFFFAYPTPMMKVLIDCTTDMDQKIRPRLISGLALLANLACKAVDSSNDQSTTMLLLCTITGCIILVDHLQPEGVFSSKSPVRVWIFFTFLINFF